jgi:hypothetical protein
MAVGVATAAAAVLGGAVLLLVLLLLLLLLELAVVTAPQATFQWAILRTCWHRLNRTAQIIASITIASIISTAVQHAMHLHDSQWWIWAEVAVAATAITVRITVWSHVYRSLLSFFGPLHSAIFTPDAFMRRSRRLTQATTASLSYRPMTTTAKVG